MAQAYCLKCRKKREIKNPQNVTLKNKRPATRGTCPNCGTKAVVDAAAVAATPSEEVREAINRVSLEMEKAFNIAAREIQEAFTAAKASIQKSISREPVVCSSCGEKNAAGAVFCFNCGSKLQK